MDYKFIMSRKHPLTVGVLEVLSHNRGISFENDCGLIVESEHFEVLFVLITCPYTFNSSNRRTK